MAKTTSTQKALLIVALISAITLSVFATLYLNGSIIGIRVGDEDEAGYKHVTLTDAQMECDQYARQELGERLKTLSVDDHSTRYDEMDNRYKIFMQAELYDDDDRQGLTKTHYVSCFSRGDRATVAKFQVIEDKDYKPSAIRKTKGGIFGWN